MRAAVGVTLRSMKMVVWGCQAEVGEVLGLAVLAVVE